MKSWSLQYEGKALDIVIIPLEIALRTYHDMVYSMCGSQL